MWLRIPHQTTKSNHQTTKPPQTPLLFSIKKILNRAWRLTHPRHKSARSTLSLSTGWGFFRRIIFAYSAVAFSRELDVMRRTSRDDSFGLICVRHRHTSWFCIILILSLRLMLVLMHCTFSLLFLKPCECDDSRKVLMQETIAFHHRISSWLCFYWLFVAQ